MSTPKLFEPLEVGGLALDNRIVIAPMCMYSAEDGCMTDWHAVHLGQLALSGAGILTIEATAVTPEGRISHADVGLYDDRTEAAMARVLAQVRAVSAMPVAIQLGHAGRKASTHRPWESGAQLAADDPRGWQTEAPSALAFAQTDRAPVALTPADLDRLCDAFAEAARRSARLGLDAIQIHAAHGYLLHQFLSPLSNTRTDGWGGDLAGRMRFPLAVFEAVKAAVPASMPVTVRLSGTDWVEGGWDLEGTIAFSKALAERGCDAIHVSSGGLHPAQQIPVGPGYQVPLARAVKQALPDMPVVAVGLITDYDHAESIVATGDADMVAIARGALYDPRWPWHAAAHLGATVKAAPQYLRCQPRQYRELFTKA
ncbi:NADH:flavin oxidoreductase/NADH oxidase [Frigidibacter sp. MR17.24]|uniref:NADH:flavin oxidoreductase/NADH oxidase n=1 Tax=Frigidibacter sp. MR17.24 TaxID=3127345 RepID=UPI003012D7FF